MVGDNESERDHDGSQFIQLSGTRWGETVTVGAVLVMRHGGALIHFKGDNVCPHLLFALLLFCHSSLTHGAQQETASWLNWKLWVQLKELGVSDIQQSL